MVKRRLPRIDVVCPLRFEAGGIRRSLRTTGDGTPPNIHITVTGPGPERMQRGLGELAEIWASEKPALVVLAGVCGGLKDVGVSPLVGAVVDQAGETWRVPGSDGKGETVVGVDAVVCSPAEKAALAERTGAGLVDTESHVFARVCDERRVRWAVVRGVSDAWDEALPRVMSGWVDETGGTNGVRVAFDLVTKPWVIGHAARVGKASNRAMREVADRVVAMCTGVLVEGHRP